MKRLLFALFMLMAVSAQTGTVPYPFHDEVLLVSPPVTDYMGLAQVPIYINWDDTLNKLTFAQIAVEFDQWKLDPMWAVPGAAFTDWMFLENHETYPCPGACSTPGNKSWVIQLSHPDFGLDGMAPPSGRIHLMTLTFMCHYSWYAAGATPVRVMCERICPLLGTPPSALLFITGENPIIYEENHYGDFRLTNACVRKDCQPRDCDCEGNGVYGEICKPDCPPVNEPLKVGGRELPWGEIKGLYR